MKSLAEFVSQHLSDDTSRLILDRKKWPDTDMELAVNCIESRRKLKGKVQEWYANLLPNLRTLYRQIIEYLLAHL